MAGMTERLIQLTLRAKDFLSRDIQPASDAVRSLAEDGRQLREALTEAGRARGLARTLRDNEQAADGLRSAWRDAQATLDDLTREIGENQQAAAGQRIAMREARQTVEEAERAYRRNQSAIKNTAGELNKLGVDTRNISAEEQRLTDEIAQNKSALDANRAAIKAKREEEKKAAAAAKEHADRVADGRGVMDRAGRQVLAFAATYVSLNAAINLVRSGVDLLRQGLGAVLGEGSKNEDALAQLNAALQSTGNAAGMTAEQLLSLAESIEKASLLGGEQIVAAETRLLSYTDVAAKEFPRALQLIIDQQQRLGISVEASAEVVGKALQSPAEAMATLGRQGFKLEAGQKQLLNQLVATGKKAEAQTIIMDMMTEAYGGAAAAARMGTFKGLLKGIGDQFGDFADRVAKAGAFDYVKRRLEGLSADLSAMADDGRLDRLADALSNAFIQGVEWVEKFASGLADVDFSKVSDDAAAWLNGFGKHLDETKAKLNAFALPFRALFNGLTAGLSLAAAAITQRLSEVLGMVGMVADQLPETLGGPKLRAAVDGARATLDALTDGFVAQVAQGGKDLSDAWSSAMGDVVDDTKQAQAEQTETIKRAADDQFEHIVQRVTDINNALSQISAVDGVTQLRQLQKELLAAYQGGRLSQTEFANATGVLNQRLADLGATSSATGGAVNKLAAELKTLADVQNAISTAKTDRDITAINAALRKLLETGQIDGAQYNAELKKSGERLKEIKAGIDGAARSQAGKNVVDKEAIVTSERLRKESGARMEAERKAIAQSVQDRRKGVADTKADMSGFSGWFGGVMSAAREPLAAMSQAAVQLFEDLRGISRADPGIDTSSLESTRQSLLGVAKALEDVKGASLNPRLSALGRWQLDTQRASLETQAAFLSQKASLQSLMDSYEKGGMSAQQFVRSARGARQALGLLDRSDLNSLSAAIRAAEQQMLQMEKSTRSSLDSLNDELDALEGREADIERRKFEGRRNDLEAQVAEAQASGNAQAVANAQRALGLLRQVEAASQQQRQRAEQEKRAAEIAAVTPAASAAPAAEPAKILRLESRGRAVDVQLGSAADETKLLDILADAGARSIS